MTRSMEKEMTQAADDDRLCGVPEHLALGLTWDWNRGELEFHFRYAEDEKAMLLQLSDWLQQDERNSIRLAEWMQQFEACLKREAS